MEAVTCHEYLHLRKLPAIRYYVFWQRYGVLTALLRSRLITSSDATSGPASASQKLHCLEQAPDHPRC